MSHFALRHTVQLAKAEKIEDQHMQAHKVDRLLAEAQRAPFGSQIRIDAGRIQPWQHTHRISELQARHSLIIESDHIDTLHEWHNALKGVPLF